VLLRCLQAVDPDSGDSTPRLPCLVVKPVLQDVHVFVGAPPVIAIVGPALRDDYERADAVGILLSPVSPVTHGSHVSVISHYLGSSGGTAGSFRMASRAALTAISASTRACNLIASPDS